MPAPPLPERVQPPRIETPVNPDNLANFKTQVSLKLGQLASIQIQVTKLINEAETTLRRDTPVYTKSTTSGTILHPLAPRKRVLEERMGKLLLEAVMPVAKSTLEMTKVVDVSTGSTGHELYRGSTSEQQWWQGGLGKLHVPLMT